MESFQSRSRSIPYSTVQYSVLVVDDLVHRIASHTQTHTHTHTLTHTHTGARTHTRTRTLTHGRTHVNMHAHAHTYGMRHMIRHSIRLSLVQIMALSSSNYLNESWLVNWNTDVSEICFQMRQFSFKNWFWICHLQNGGHSFSAPIY